MREKTDIYQLVLEWKTLICSTFLNRYHEKIDTLSFSRLLAVDGKCTKSCMGTAKQGSDRQHLQPGIESTPCLHHLSAAKL